MTRVMKIALNMLATIPIISVSANPCTGPVPNWYRMTPVMKVVRFESKIAVKAFSYPASIAARRVLPGGQFLADAFVDQDVGVHGHRERQDDAGDAGQREGSLERRQDGQQEEQAEDQRNVGDRAAGAVVAPTMKMIVSRVAITSEKRPRSGSSLRRATARRTAVR